MLATIQYNSRKLQIDLTKPLDISIAIRSGQENVNAWYIGNPEIEPVVIEEEDWVGSVVKGSAVNFNTIIFNPHAHGTHTECVGHITETVYSVNKNLKQFFFLAEVITVAPEKLDDDFVISKKQIQFALGNKKRDAVVIRTIPNLKEKLTKRYSKTNPTYLLEEAAIYLREKGIKHLLIDLPSVDKERDEGKLLSHNAFWNTQGKLRLDATITEFIYVPNKVKDGEYMLNLQIASFENDATPSKPVLYKIIE
ncbi:MULTISPECIES: cyclase family protein [Aestuariibaculum]|uniref:Cyclase family protein n=1 Tax=Aestuariibaculum lutulentum TaxID=2920935 RepID=A0ABS9RFN6_9FLAO|nr:MULTISPECIES: cyclase family protein [Aestuariibaculum]MCH4551760.1 cyclase family protein [Aestuariibaculum lutulentum]MCR8666863.1 cyclase family protein [Aestuariibaculum sp. M13]